MLKETITSLDEVPEGMREHYGPAAEGANGFELQIEGVGPLRNALRNERQFRKNAEGRVRELETQVRHLRGLPPPEKTPRERFFEDAGRRLAGLEGEALVAERAKLEQEMQPILEAEVAEHRRGFETRIEAQRRTISRLMRENAANELILRIRRPGIEARVLLPLVLDHFDVKEEAGEFSVVVKGPDGEPISADALADELRSRPEFARLVQGASAEEKAEHARRVAETLGQTRPNGAAR